MIGIRLEKKNQYQKEIDLLPCPKEITIDYQKEDIITVRKKDLVKTGMTLGTTKEGQAIISSATGIVLKTTPKIIIKTKEDILINKKNMELITCLKEAGIYGLSGSFKPTYQKYQKAKTLIVNAVECEPYVQADYAIAVNYMEEIKTMINTLLEQLYDEVVIAFSGHDRTLVELFTTNFANVDKVRLLSLPNLYPLGWEKSLVRCIKHVDYDKDPLEVGCVVSNISTIYAIYEAYFLGKPLYERVITVITDNKKQNVWVRNGMKVKDILQSLQIPYENKKIILGGLMMGKAVTASTVVTLKDNAIFCIEQEKQIEQPCIRCGKCTNTCPVKLQPILIKEHLDKKGLERLHPEKCIDCSICSYICPSRIPLKKYILKAKKQVDYHD